jgi:chitin disaccharide deacetylase
MLELASEYHCAIRYGIPPPGDPDTQGIPTQRLADIQQAAPPLLAEFGTPHPHVFLGSFYDQTATREHLLALVRNLPEGISELMSHPGIVDETLLAGSAYNRQRERELAILTDPEVMEAVQRGDVELISFGELGN